MKTVLPHSSPFEPHIERKQKVVKDSKQFWTKFSDMSSGKDFDQTQSRFMKIVDRYSIPSAHISSSRKSCVIRQKTDSKSDFDTTAS